MSSVGMGYGGRGTGYGKKNPPYPVPLHLFLYPVPCTLFSVGYNKVMFSSFIAVVLFVFGLAFGSFFNVLTMRYDGEAAFGDPRVIGGRSHCRHCRVTLRWFELVPVLSFLVQGGTCRHCGARLSAAYPIVELATALIFFAVPWRLAAIYPDMNLAWWALAGLLVAAFSVLLLITIIDVRLGIIPDGLVVGLAAVAVAIVWLAGNAALAPFSFLGFLMHAPSWWMLHIVGALGAGAFFLLLWLLTRGKGMGMGDVKLAIPLGLLFGWPAVAWLAAVAFVAGAAVGVAMIAARTKTMESALPFGPFLAFAAAFIFFFGADIASWYVNVFVIR